MRDDCCDTQRADLAVFRATVEILQHVEGRQTLHLAEENHLAIEHVPGEQQADMRVVRQLLRLRLPRLV